MRYSVSNWIYGDEPLEETLQRLSRCGFDGVELVGEPDRYRPVEVRRLCDAYKLEVFSIAGMFPWPTDERDLANPYPAVRKRAVSYVRSCVDFAGAVGARIVIVVPSAVPKTEPVAVAGIGKPWDEAYREEWQNAVESVREAARYAEDKGIVLAIEPINRFESYLVNSAEQGIRFISDVGSGAVRLHLDTFHMNIEEAAPAEAVRSARDLLVNVHISDSNRQAVGRGHFDFKEFLRALRDIGYTGPLTLEPLPPVPNANVATRLDRYRPQWEEYIAQSMRRLRELECAA